MIETLLWLLSCIGMIGLIIGASTVTMLVIVVMFCAIIKFVQSGK